VFALLDAGSVQRINTAAADVGVLRHYKGVSLSTRVAGTAVKTLSLAANCLKPLSPAAIGGGRDAANNITINWKRRARLSAGWRAYVDVPLDEPTESYEVDVFAGTPKAIAGISRENPGVITIGAHGYSVGDTIFLHGIVGMTQLNDRAFTVAAVLSSSTFTIGEDTTMYTTYTTGGSAYKRARTLTAATPTAVYSAANQTTDYGSAQSPVYVAAYQISSRIGRGYAGTGAL
jgi:hypothetical protein